MKKKSKKW